MEKSLSVSATTRVFAWFFAALSMLALLSPPGATHDEWYHASSIWCGHGIREPYCLEIGLVPEEGRYVALTNLDAINCQVSPRFPLVCPTSRSGQSSPVTNDGLYPRVFYYALSWFVIPSAEASFVVTRVASALLISMVLAALFWALPRPYRWVLLLMILTSFSSTGFFLFASINPSSWTVFGVGVSWLALHAALAPGTARKSKRYLVAMIGAVAALMAGGSRWDAIPFLALSASLTLLHVAWLRYPNRRKQLFSLAVAGPSALWILLEYTTPLSPLENLQRLYTFTDGQPDNVAFFSDNILQGLPNALRALGTVPTMTQILLPEIIFIGSLLLLGHFMSRSYSKATALQMVGFGVVSVVIALVIMAQVALNDNRDTGGIEPRYSYPLLVFAIGWWFTTGRDDLEARTIRFVRPAVSCVVILFALMTITVAERYVDRQTFGVRILPEGPDQWWWPWMPVGPNVIVLLASLFLWRFLNGLVSLFSHAPKPPQTA